MKKGLSTSIGIFCLFSLLILNSSCEKDESDTSGGSGFEFTDPGGFTEFPSDIVIPTPTGTGLHSMYTKYLNKSGIPVVGTSGVHDEALIVGDQIISFLLLGMPDVRDELIQREQYYVLRVEAEPLQSLPEFANSTAAATAGEYRGFEGVATSTMEDVLCISPDASGLEDNTFLHEMAHMIQISGLDFVRPEFAALHDAAFNNAVSNGIWQNTYAQTNKYEYFAEILQVWFETNWPYGPPGGDGFANDIITREQFQDYDPMGYELISSYFNPSLNVPGCIQNNTAEIWVDPSISCGNSVSDIDGNQYDVVRLGDQCWMADNLRTSRFRDGTEIPVITGDEEWISANTPAMCYFENENSNNEPHGRLYNYRAISSALGICPEGWHVPTLGEWEDLATLIGQLGYGPEGLKSTTGWNQTLGPDANISGYNAFPSGIRQSDGSFSGQGHTTYFWSSDQDGSEQAFIKALWSNLDALQTRSENMEQGLSCRCIKD